MGIGFSSRCKSPCIVLISTCLLLYLSACGNGAVQPAQHNPVAATTPQHGEQQNGDGSLGLQVPGQQASPTPSSTPQASPTPTAGQPISDSPHPVLAFYYAWYHPSDWSLSKMSDLPTIRYTSSDDATIDRQMTSAANAGITGFISSWWGGGGDTDTNFAKVLQHAATLESKTHYHFASTIYFESDSPILSGTGNMVKGLRYLMRHYANDPHFFHWQGKPVFFF